MHSRIREAAQTLAPLGALWVLLAAPAAGAQAPPDPFADYLGEFRPQPAASATARGPQPLAPDPAHAGPTYVALSEVGPAPVLPVAKGTWVAGGSTSVAVTRSENDLLGGGSATNRTVYVGLTPSLSYMIAERVELGGSLGVLLRSLEREGGGASTGRDWLLEAMVAYHLPITRRFTLAPGLGVGGYFGSNDRTVQIVDDAGDNKDIDETTDTRGFLAVARLVGAYQISERGQLRAGLQGNVLYGSEGVQSEDTRLDVMTLTAQLTLGLYFTF